MDGESHCLNYKVTWKHEDFETVKIFDPENQRSKKCVVFSDKHGMEGLLYVEARFRKIADAFEFDGPQRFEAFEEVLQGTALTSWERIADEIVEEDRTEETFDDVVSQFYLEYCDKNAKDTMYDYLNNRCKKPVGEEPRKHVKRMEVLYAYAAKLPGMEENMTDDQIKRSIFKTFPETWRKQYMRSGKDLQTDTMQDIITFMQNEKSYADEEKGKKRITEETQKKNKKQKSNGGNYNNSNNRGGRVQPDDECPIHSGHKWIDCIMNPKGPNYRPGGGRTNNGFRGGPGNGRGFQPQGRGGRGNRFAGRGGRGQPGQNQALQHNTGYQNNNGYNNGNQNTNYNFERIQDQDQNRGQVRNGADARPQGQQQRDRNPRELHYFDHIGEDAWDHNEEE